MQKTLGLILKKQNVGETDRIVTFFSPNLGKKRAIARGVRRPLSRLAGHLDTFMVTQLILTDQPELPKITSAVLVEAFEEVRGSLVSLDRAFAVTKIIERTILEEVNQQSIFQLTLDTFVRMNNGLPWSNTWLYFLGSLTERLGLSLSDFNCLSCHKKITASAWWLPEERKFVCQECREASGAIFLEANSIKLLSLLQRQPYRMIERVTLPSKVACQVEEVLLREITQWFNKPWTSYSDLQRIS